MSEDLKLGTFVISPSVSSLKVHKLWKAGTEMFLTIKKKKKKIKTNLEDQMRSFYK